MRFPYTILGSSRERPIIPVLIQGNGPRFLTRALLDTGADASLFPYQLALYLGVALGPSRQIGTATGQSVSYRPGRVTLELRSVAETIRWSAEVGFTAVPLTVPVLGDQGVLQHFLCSFDGQLREVELTPKLNLPRIT